MKYLAIGIWMNPICILSIETNSIDVEGIVGPLMDKGRKEKNLAMIFLHEIILVKSNFGFGASSNIQFDDVAALSPEVINHWSIENGDF